MLFIILMGEQIKYKAFCNEFEVIVDFKIFPITETLLCVQCYLHVIFQG